MRVHTYARNMLHLRVLVLFLVGLIGLVPACATLRAAESPAVELLGCTSRALLPVTGTYERAEATAKAIQAGSAHVEDVLQAAHATVEESARVYSELRACAEAFKAALPSDAGAPDADAAP